MLSEQDSPNRSLQVTFDTPLIFTAEKTVAASNAPELRRELKSDDYPPPVAPLIRVREALARTLAHYD
jgi:hypothetical protein